MQVKSTQVLNGDCLKLLGIIPDNSIDLIYLDPPFFSQTQQKLSTRDGSALYSFSDQWEDVNEYVQYLRTRVQECKNKLKPTGSLFLHCDRSESHYLKIMLDEVFGASMFQSEII